jgi:FAD/FMN-containing dehydrogenase
MSFRAPPGLIGMTSTHHVAQQLRRRLRGPVHVPGEPGYDSERATWSAAIDPRPAVVAAATGAADVQAALLAARDHDLPFAVQATGHGTIVPADGGLLLKTGAMAEVLVDPDRRIARVGPGARWGQVIAAAAPFGLAPLSGYSPDVGVAGFTLGGGVDWLSRRFGFAADSLLRADVVTADGELVRATPDRNGDLFWALRGGGGNFGVVTSLELRLYPVEQVYAGTALFPIARAGEALEHYRDWGPELPDELTTTVVLLRESPDPAIEGPVLAVRGVYAGPRADAMVALRPLWDVAGPALGGDFREARYADVRVGGTAPRNFELYRDLPDAVIDGAIEAIMLGAANAIDVRLWGGAMTGRGVDAGPVGHRDVPFSITVDGPAETAAPLARSATGGSFLNFLHDTSRTESAYTAASWERLREIKRAYDPDNVFRLGHNIPPARGAYAARLGSAKSSAPIRSRSSAGTRQAASASMFSVTDRS